MSAIHVGDTIKITGADRHPLSDALLLDNVDLSEANIVDIGASDGSTSVDLVGKLTSFATFTIADLFFHLDTIRVGRRDLFFGPDGDLVLVAGPRMLGWPSQSPAVERLYRPLRRKTAGSTDRRKLLLLNPAARRLIAADPRVRTAVHDIFQSWTGDPPDVIKVANLLRRLYFSDERITAALSVLLSDLVDGGHLLVVDNPRIGGIAERGGLYRRGGDRFERVALTSNSPEIDDLVVAVRLTKDSG